MDRPPQHVLPTLAGIEAARDAIRPYLQETPIVRSELLSRALLAEVWLKLEMISPVASFKGRGALTELLRARKRGTLGAAVTSSTGNHGQGVAFAARALGIPAHVFMPDPPNPLKRRMVSVLGGTVHLAGHDIDGAKEAAQEFASEKGLPFVDDGESLDVMEGAATVGLEIAERMGAVDAVFVPMGSGNLAAGCASAIKSQQPEARIIAVQSEGAPAMVESFHARLPVERPIDTVADGLVCRIPAGLALEALLTFVDDAVAVTDRQLLAAVHTMAEAAHVLVEPSGAAGLAAAWAARGALEGYRLVLVLTGANVTAPILKTALRDPPLIELDGIR
jgi:threonine dehydratase